MRGLRTSLVQAYYAAAFPAHPARTPIPARIPQKLLLRRLRRLAIQFVTYVFITVAIRLSIDDSVLNVIISNRPESR